MDQTPQPSAPAQDDKPRMPRVMLLLGFAGLSLALDLITKAWAWANLRDGQSITLIDRWAYLEFGFNTGSAFSFLRDAPYARTVFIVVTLLTLGYMAYLARTLPTRWASPFIAIGLVAGGAMGNLHDRLVRVMELDGEMRYGVVDFIRVFYWPNQPWPTFNVADVALVVGLALLFLFPGRQTEAAQAGASVGKDSPEPAPSGS